MRDQAGYWELVRGNPNFRRLWLGNVVSLLGDWFNTIALYTLVSRLTGSPFALGAVFIFKMLPWALASPIAGILVDRYNRRRLMIASDLLRAVVVLGFLLIDEVSEVYLLYGLIALQVVVGAVFQPAKSASIPNITTPRELLTANALMAASWSVMLAFGAALGGFATEAFGEQAVFLLDSATYLVSAVFIVRTTIPQDTEAGRGPILRTAAREILDGWRRMRAVPRVGRIALAKASWAVGGGACVYLLTLLGDEIAPEALAAGIGVLFAARGVGTGIGPVVARSVFKNEERWPLLLGACIVFTGLCYLLVGFVGWALGVVIGLIVLAHTAGGANWVLATVLLQKRTEDRYRGRVFATEWLLVMLADTVSILSASVLLEVGLVDLRLSFRIFALIQILCGLLWIAVVVPRERAAAVA
ncbi:MAG: MFS transporter [Rhodothermales bacterium]|nr:MFS transporter [Rhodothermales bacterium]